MNLGNENFKEARKYCGQMHNKNQQCDKHPNKTQFKENFIHETYCDI